MIVFVDSLLQSKHTFGLLYNEWNLILNVFDNVENCGLALVDPIFLHFLSRGFMAPSAMFRWQNLINCKKSFR